MANTLNNPTQGFQVFGRMEGASPTAGLTPVWIASTDASLIFRGDPVYPSTSPGTNQSGRYITSVQVASYAQPLAGVFMGLEQYQPSVGRVVWSNFYNAAVTGSTGDVKAYICDDPDVLFQIQGSSGAAILSSQIGLNISFTNNSTTGNTLLGFSNVAAASSNILQLSSLPFRLVDFWSAFTPPAIPAIGTNAFLNGADNTTPSNIVLVRKNNCERLNLTSRSSS